MPCPVRVLSFHANVVMLKLCAEEKQDQIKNPSRWLISAVSRETSGPYPEQTRARALPMPAVYAPPARAMHGPAGAGMSSADDTKIHRRASWLNGNVFPDRPIDEADGRAKPTCYW